MSSLWLLFPGAVVLGYFFGQMHALRIELSRASTALEYCATQLEEIKSILHAQRTH